MAYHFRKLRQTLRLIPSTKSFGFSTRVSEGDQNKNSHIDGSTGTLSISYADHVEKALPCPSQVMNDSFGATSCMMQRLTSDSNLLHHLKSAMDNTTIRNLPVSYKDLVQIVLSCPEQGRRHSLDDIDSVLTSVKSVDFTSDDILVQPFSSFSTDANIGHVTLNRKKIAVDVLTQHGYKNTLASHTWSQSVTTSKLDSIVLNNHSVRVFPASRQQSDSLTHLYCSPNRPRNSTSEQSGHSRDGPSPEQMYDAREKLQKLVCSLFKGQHNYEMLHKNVVMENNLFGDNKATIGVNAYKFELFKLRLRVHAQFFSTSMEILSVTTLEHNGVIRIHWRLKGLLQIQNLKFWRLWSRESIGKDDWEWLEAFSYFHIGKDGLVHKHRIDRMMPDNEAEPDLTEKLRGLLNPAAKPLVS